MRIFVPWSTNVNAMLVERVGFPTTSAKKSVTFRAICRVAFARL